LRHSGSSAFSQPKRTAYLADHERDYRYVGEKASTSDS